MSTDSLFNSVDSIEFYVGSAKQWAYFHEKAMGFKLVGYSGPETGVRDRTSYLMQQGDARLMFTGFLYRQSEISRHVELHGDGVKEEDLTYIAEKVGQKDQLFMKHLKNML